MKYLLTGNGINMQFDNVNYSTQQIVYRILKNCDREDFPSHIIVDFPYLLKNYIGLLFLEVKNIIRGEYDKFANCSAEKESIVSFKEQYGNCLSKLKMTDIGFEDYYLIHDLVCHKTKTGNPEQFYIREAMRIAYLFAIYNDGKIDKLHNLYPEKFVAYLNGFDSIFTTNYDSNIDLVCNKSIFHIHGHFEKLSAVYDANSFRNMLPDAPIKTTMIDPMYYYLYSNALTTHCGNYKEFQLKQYSLANNAVEKLSKAYISNPNVKKDVDSWIKNTNTITANMGHAVKLKIEHPEIKFKDDYHFDKLSEIKDEIEILGLSPWNDFHIFETINNADINKCVFYYFSKEQCEKVKSLLPDLEKNKILEFKSSNEFWRQMYE